MLFIFLFNFWAGIETGLVQPVFGLEINHQGGLVYRIFCGRDFNISSINLGFNGSYYAGKNAGYSFMTSGFRIEMFKFRWRYSPYFGFGIDYIERELRDNKEWGLGFAYSLGIKVNFHFDQVNIYPALFYAGLTDFKTTAGALGLKLGIGYEF